MFRLEKSLLGFEIVLDIIDDDEDVDFFRLLFVNGVVSCVGIVVMVGLNVVSRSVVATDKTGLKVCLLGKNLGFLVISGPLSQQTLGRVFSKPHWFDNSSLFACWLPAFTCKTYSSNSRVDNSVSDNYFLCFGYSMHGCTYRVILVFIVLLEKIIFLLTYLKNKS